MPAVFPQIQITKNSYEISNATTESIVVLLPDY
jgi:hypothetical protein